MNGSSVPLLPLVLDDVPHALRKMLAQEGVPTTANRPVADDAEPPGRFVLYDSARRSRPQHLSTNQTAIDIAHLRIGFDRDPFSESSTQRTARSWWRVGPWEACEETTAVDKRTIRMAIVAPLRRELERLGGVWMRLAQVPSPYRTAFNFRFDHDRYVDEDFAAVMNAVAGYEGMTTHFVCASTHSVAANPGVTQALRRLADCDVGSHGYHHAVYSTEAENRGNLLRGIEVLFDAGLMPQGFAAPHGRYNAALAAAMQSAGITHSSEFGLAFDDLPFEPEGSDVLQLPVHPVCLGIVLEAAARATKSEVPAVDELKGSESHRAAIAARAAAAVSQYFLATASAKRAAGELIFLYGHPDGRLGKYPHILLELFAAVGAWSDVWKTSLSEFAQWWRVRESIQLVVRRVDAGYEIHSSSMSQRFPAAVLWDRGPTTARLPLDATTIRVDESANFAPLNYSTHAEAVPRPLRFEPIRGLRERIRRALDWEYATPIDEIDVRRWRGRLKRSLRRWKARSA